MAELPVMGQGGSLNWSIWWILIDKPLTLTEIIKDWIVKPLRDQHVKPKAAAVFKCELFKDTPNWKWLKGENEVVPSDKIEIKKEGKELTLTIKNCQPEDVAEYGMEVEGRLYTAKLTLGGLSVYLFTFLLTWVSQKLYL